jgi:hypothetical protein
MTWTARLLACVTSPGRAATANSSTLLPPRSTLKEKGVSWPGVACSVAISSPLSLTVTSAVPPGLGPSSKTRSTSLRLLVDDAEAWRLDDLDAAVELVGLAGDQAVDRGIEAERLVDAGDVVDLAVGEHDGAADAGGRHVGEGGLQRVEEARRGRVGILGLGGVDIARLDVGEAGKAVLQLRQRIVGHLDALGRLLALAAVDDNGHDGRELLAVFLQEHGLASAASSASAATLRTQAPRTLRKIARPRWRRRGQSGRQGSARG